MNAPIINTEALEAGLAQTKKEANNAKYAFSSTTDADVVQQPPPKLPKQPRGLLAADTRRYRPYRDRNWRQQRLNRYRRYDRGTLSPLLGPVNTYSGIRQQPLPILSGILSSLLQPGNPKSTAQSLARAYSGGNSEAAAQAVAGAAAGAGGSSQATTVAQALTEAAVSHPQVAPGELRLTKATRVLSCWWWICSLFVLSQT